MAPVHKIYLDQLRIEWQNATSAATDALAAALGNFDDPTALARYKMACRAEKAAYRAYLAAATHRPRRPASHAQPNAL